MTRRSYATSAVPVGGRDPAAPAAYDDADVVAIQALVTGTADAAQQQRALRWIVERAADTYGLSYRGGDAAATAFAEGKRCVGLQIVKLSKLRLDKLRAADSGEDPA
ncbi:MAG TPA: hypothetical protein VJ890_07605 [Vineibacter sp.]|nr:hypothetical protein [Vineibacter sp.]